MILVTLCLGGVAAVEAQQITQTQSSSAAGASPDVDAIIRAFTAKETEFSKALNNYGFKRDAVVQTIGMGEQITGEYRRTSQFSFDDRGNRYERINYFPQPTLTEVSFTQEDLEDLGGVQPFALEASKIDRYKFSYVGKERIDELDLYVFDVAPRVMPKKVGDRLFQGRVWVDDRDLQIVKVRGKGVPEGKQRFPIFETYREQVDGRYWFPTYTSVDDELVFPGGQTVHLRMTVRYTDYRRFKGSVRVIEEDEPGLAPR
jgi:nitrogen regulatory protein PII